MIKFKIDDMGDDGVFETMVALAEFLGCTFSNVNWHTKHSKDADNHFYCRGYGVTILQERRPDYETTQRCKEVRKKYRETHKDQMKAWQKEWRAKNVEHIKELKAQWREKNREHYNEYMRNFRKKQKGE